MLMKNKNTIMKIIADKKDNIKLEFDFKITKLQSVKKNKGKTLNTFYVTNFPRELQDFMDVIDQKIYLYEKEGVVYVTSRPPLQEHQMLKVKKNGHISVSKRFFKPEEFSEVVFVLDLVAVDGWRGGAPGLLSMCLR